VDDLMSMREIVAHWLSCLTCRECEIIKLRYGIGDVYAYTLEEVGKIFKVPPEVVMRIECQAICKMKAFAFHLSAA
jgi:RNA polymerase primary sigma factor